MDNYAKKLGKYIKEANIQCEHMYFQESCHSVEDAMKAADAKREDFIKNICLIDPKKKLIVRRRPTQRFEEDLSGFDIEDVEMATCEAAVVEATAENGD